MFAHPMRRSPPGLLLRVFAALPALAALCTAPPAHAFDGAFVAIEGGTWDVSGGPIEYVLEPTGSDDVSDGSDLQALRDAFRAWQCVPGTSIRFVEGDRPGPANIDLSDGQNTLFWDETGVFDLGPGTLGVTVGDTSGNRAAADIVFNGSDSTWSSDDRPSAVDIGAIAIHEIGHFLGLDHPCDRQGGQEVNCNGAELSVMAPTWNGELDRAPLDDDAAGVVALYASGDANSSCDGPRRRGEACSCSGECTEGLVCAALVDDKKVCTEPCASDASDCGNGFACVLLAPQGDEPAPGICIKHAAGDKPAGAVCSVSGECGSGVCLLLFDVQRSLCQEPCSSPSDCGAGACFAEFCLGGVEIAECPGEEPPGCACSAAHDGPSPAPPLLSLLFPCALLLWARKRGFL